MKTMQRNNYIDIIKAIAIFFVVIGHVFGAFISNHHITVPLGYKLAYLTIYSFHMPVFFIVSGLFADKWVTRDLKTAFLNKVQRLVIPYFLFAFFLAVMKQLGGRYASTPGGIKSFLMSPFIPFNIYWFVYILFFAFASYYLIMHLKIGKKKLTFLSISLVLFLLHPFMPKLWILPTFSRFLIFFATGTYMLEFMDSYPIATKNNSDINLKKNIYVLVIAFIASIFVYDYLYINKYSLAMRYWFIVTGMLGFLNCFVFARFIDSGCFGKTAPLLWGKMSMELYCLHPFVIGFYRVLLNKFIKVENIYSVTFVLAVLTILSLNFVVKRIPIENKYVKIIFGEQ